MIELPGYFDLAKNVAQLSNCRIKVGAVVARKKPLIACYNKQITHPKYVDGTSYINSIHAEVRCCLHLSDEQTEDAVIYVYRESERVLSKKIKKKPVRGIYYPALARPCNFCMEVLIEKGIKKVFYTIPEYPYFDWERIN